MIMSDEILGKTFNSLTVVKVSDTRKWESLLYDCSCVCGEETQATKYQLVNSKKKSCGCARKGAGKHSKYDVEIGQRFERLVVTSEKKDSVDGHYRCEVLCDCGNSKTAIIRQLIKGLVVSCGCKRETQNLIHGMSKSRPSSIYGHMVRRCTTDKEANYEYYGGIGIKVCEEWSTFLGFWTDMQEGYSDELELDRIDPKGDYCKENCRWTTRSIQNFNTKKKIQNTSGRTGVSWSSKKDQWEVYISKDKKRFALGFYDDFELACFIREEAELKYYGFTKE